MNRALLSSKDMDWCTPQDFFDTSKIKLRMLCALALCGQVRRDDLAIFAWTANAGVRTIRELESRGLVEDRDVEVMVRIDERNRPRERHVCNLTKAGLLFLLEHGAALGENIDFLLATTESEG